ncbi:MAG: hypothetical protein KJ658_05185 [Proteobacteria bacterium]|nr:hypothetical protein [Desulfobacula sp.]MBU3951512.1 hypothetical protein [Pseudomonadota bacterium]
MGTEQEKINSKPYMQKVQNIQKVEEKGKTKAFAPFALIVPKIQNENPYQNQFDTLWEKATNLADWIEDSSSTIPFQERAARVPELQKMSMMLDELKQQISRPGNRQNRSSKI